MRSFFFTAPATTVTYTLSLHDALPISENTIGVFRIFHQCPGREPLLVSQLHPAKIQHRVLHGTDDALSFAGFFPLKKCCQNTRDQVNARAGIADLRSRDQWRTVIESGGARR